MSYGLVVCDASPLITLAFADELDLLLKPPWPITIPDAVYREAASEAHADGVMIARWIEAHSNRVRVAATEAGIEQDVLLRAGLRARNAGENAALETINRYLAAVEGERAILLYEDDDVRKLPILDRTELVTTGQYLLALEEAHLIQSADYVLDKAARAGRNTQLQRTGSLPSSPIALVRELERAANRTHGS